MPWGFQNSAACREMNAEAAVVLLNLQAQKKGFRDHDDAIPWAYADGPIQQRREATARGLFTLVRLGIVSVVEASAIKDGKYRKTRYTITRRWVEYDPARPGIFLLEQRSASSSWKACFNDDGTWSDGTKPEIAPRRKKPSPRGGLGSGPVSPRVGLGEGLESGC